MEQTNRFVLDSWAVLAYYEGGTSGNRVSELFIDAVQRRVSLWMSVVNAAEVWYIVARQTSAETADRTMAELKSFGVQFDNAELPLALAAARFKAKHKMSLADAFAAALTVQRRASLITGDPEFNALEREVKILWLR